MAATVGYQPTTGGCNLPRFNVGKLAAVSKKPDLVPYQFANQYAYQYANWFAYWFGSPRTSTRTSPD
ncbi:hypothetical protein ACHWQZ_G017039 [Mnemiopsis leidyi]